MRIFDPKDQLGNSLLSQADTQKSSVKLEKQMAVGGGAITLTSTDISDIENWELSNASVEVDGQMISFLPDTSRDGDGNLIVTLGETFSDVVLVLKRTVFDGMKQEEEEITIEVKIQQLMEKTLATAGKDGYNADKNIQEWQKLGEETKATGEEKYRYADVVEWTGDEEVGPIVTEQFLSLQTVPKCVFVELGVLEWKADLPCLQNGNSAFNEGPIEVFEGNMPNLVDGRYMFQYCRNLQSFISSLPCLTNARSMFEDCSSLTSFQSDMPASLTTNAYYMFFNCKLDIESVERISRTIAICTSTYGWDNAIHLGVSQACHDDTNFQNYIDAMEQKGWTVVVYIH